MSDNPGQALVPALHDGYELYILDQPPRPSSLPVSPHIHYLVSSVHPLHTVLAEHAFSGILHLGGIELEEECRYADETCTKSYEKDVEALLGQLQSKGVKRWWKAGSKPWLILGTDAPVVASVQGEDPSPARASVASVESMLKFYVENYPTADGSPSPAAIVRFGHIYGYRPTQRTPGGFVHRVIVNGILSTSVQYDSDMPPVDLVHVEDGIAGLISAMRRFDTAPSSNVVAEYNLVSGRLTPVKEVIKKIMTSTESHSPLKDLGSGASSGTTWIPAQASIAESVLGWKPEFDLDGGLREAIKTIHQSSVDWAESYLASECQGSNALPSRMKNKELWKLDGCAANIAFNRGGFLDYVKCPKNENGTGTPCTVDNNKVVSYNWGADVFNIRRVGSSRKDGRVTVSFEEEKGRGYLGLPLGGEVPEFRLVETPEEAKVTFDLEVASDNSYLRFLLPDGHQLRAVASTDSTQTVFRLAQPGEYDARLNLLCCPMEGDWPLLEDDCKCALRVDQGGG